VQLPTALVGAAGYTRGRYPGRHDINPFPRLLVRYQPTKCGVMWKPLSPNSDSKKSPIGPCSMSQTQVLMNLGALLGAATTAVLGTAESEGAVAIALAVLAAGAFASALCATKRSGPRWLPVLAVVLNVAAVLELCALAVIAGLRLDGSLPLMALHAAGAAVAGWNVVCLSTPAAA
jgi:hypothetical protein